MLELNKKTLRNVFWVVVACIFFYWVLHETERVGQVVNYIGRILSPFAAGAAIAFILNVPVRAFENLLKGIKQNGLRRVISIVLTFISVALVVSLVFWLLIPQLLQTVQSLVPQLYVFLTDLGDKLKEFLYERPELMNWAMENTDLSNLDWATLVQEVVSVVGNSITTIISGAVLALGTVASAMVDAIIAVVFAIYCLFQKDTLARQGKKLLYAFFPERFSDQVIRVFRLSNNTFSNFLSGQCVEVCILGSMFAISMAIFRMPYIPLVSVLVAVTAFVPIVGAWIGCVFGAFLILVVDPMLAVWFVVMFLILQQIENNMIYPRVVGTSIGLSGMWVLVAVAVGGELMGVVGMFLMIPAASVLYTLLRESTAKRLAARNIDQSKFVEQPVQSRPLFKAFKKTNKNKAEAVEQSQDKKE